MKDEKRKEAQICYLTKEEMNDPQGVQSAFKEDFSIEAVRKLIVTMRDICSTTENIPYGDPKAREDLFYMTDKMIRFFEASYIQLGRINVQMYMGQEHVQYMQIRERRFFPRLRTGPLIVPCISLYGKWLAEAGFRVGDQVAVVSGGQKVFITLSNEWEEKSNEAKARA